jgi:hypothetical protein
MFKKVLISIFCILLPIYAAIAEELTLQKNAPTSYVVKKGDTLWDISAIFLKQPWLWPKLWRLNPEINNPHLIYPGDELRLVYDEQGQPMLVKGKPKLKWSPHVRKQLKNQNPVSIISLSDIAPYIRYESLLTQAQVDTLPYVLGSNEGHKSSIDDFNIYIKGDLNLGQTYAFYNKGKKIIDPQSQKMIGYYAKFIGTGKAIRAGDIENNIPATIYLDSVKREVRSGDFVLPVNEGQLLPAYYTMQAAAKDFNGTIIKAATQNREFAKLDVVMINKGENDHVKLGDIMSINRQSPQIIETTHGAMYLKDASSWDRLTKSSDYDYKMPTEALGKLMIFKTYPEVSMGLILTTKKPIRLQDNVSAPF